MINVIPPEYLAYGILVELFLILFVALLGIIREVYKIYKK